MEETGKSIYGGLAEEQIAHYCIDAVVDRLRGFGTAIVVVVVIIVSGIAAAIAGIIVIEYYDTIC